MIPERKAVLMKSRTPARMLALLLAGLFLMLTLCACGSELDGTWTSQADKATKIRFKGEKVRVTRGKFKMNGVYEADETNPSLITLTLTDDDGNRYRLIAEFTVDKNYLTLKNTAGDSEVFRK